MPAYKLWRLGRPQALWCKWELMVEDNGRWIKCGSRSEDEPAEAATRTSRSGADEPGVLSERGQTQVCVCSGEAPPPLRGCYNNTPGWPLHAAASSASLHCIGWMLPSVQQQ